MNTSGAFDQGEGRPDFKWPVAHTQTKNNTKLWKLDRPIPMGYSMPMDWHHMMPWNAIRDCWTALVTSKRWDVLEVWFNLLALDDPTLKSVPKTILAEMQGKKEKEDLKDGDIRDALSMKVCWAKWNLVEGPNQHNRTDDPGEGFDKFTSIKFSNNIRDRCQMLNSIYQMVSGWGFGKEVSDTEGKLLTSSFTSLNSYKNSPVPMFEPTAWVIVQDGKYDNFGNASRHPTWKKA